MGTVKIFARILASYPGFYRFHTASDKSLGRPGYEATKISCMELLKPAPGKVPWYPSDNGDLPGMEEEI